MVIYEKPFNFFIEEGFLVFDHFHNRGEVVLLVNIVVEQRLEVVILLIVLLFKEVEVLLDNFFHLLDLGHHTGDLARPLFFLKLDKIRIIIVNFSIDFN